MDDVFQITEAEQAGEAGLNPALQKLVESGKPVTVSAVAGIFRQDIIALTRALTDSQNELENQSDEHSREKRGFLTRLLELGDSLDRLIKLMNPNNELANSLQVLRTQYWQILGDEEVAPLEMELGDLFNRETCEFSQKVIREDLAQDTIITIERRGYTWQGKLLRRARVTVSVKA